MIIHLKCKHNAGRWGLRSKDINNASYQSLLLLYIWWYLDIISPNINFGLFYLSPLEFVRMMSKNWENTLKRAWKSLQRRKHLHQRLSQTATRSLATVLCIYSILYYFVCVFLSYSECNFVCFLLLHDLKHWILLKLCTLSFCHMSVLCNNISVYVQNWIASFILHAFLNFWHKTKFKNSLRRSLVLH